MIDIVSVSHPFIVSSSFRIQYFNWSCSNDSILWFNSSTQTLNLFMPYNLLERNADNWNFIIIVSFKEAFFILIEFSIFELWFDRGRFYYTSSRRSHWTAWRILLKMILITKKRAIERRDVVWKIVKIEMEAVRMVRYEVDKRVTLKWKG